MKRFIFEGDIGMTITEVIEKNAATHPTKPYLYFKEVEISYGMLKEIVSKIANGLLLLGVRKGDRICFLLGNCPEFLYFQFACARIGAVYVPLNTAYKREELKYVLNHSEASLVVVSREFEE